MSNPVAELQQLTNKSIIELFSVELQPDLHYTKDAKTAQYTQSGTDITINLTAHGFSVGLILSLNFVTGGAADGIYTIKTVATDSFTVKALTSASITGTHNVTFNVNTNLQNPTVYLFHSGVNMSNQNIVWQSNTYTKFPCQAQGFKYSGKGTLPRPIISFSNVLGSITDIIELANKTTPFSDLQNAKVTRRRTLSRFLDEENFPSNINPYKVDNVDPTAEFPREIYFIDKKTVENKDIVQFEMVSSFDLPNINAPKKLVTHDDFSGVGRFVNF
tara:strand:+ start:3154 stop:3975 length:822 start_codon:yes stop_codon:yes gene_type:complete